MKPIFLAIGVWICLSGAANRASANCAVVNTMDNLHTLQTRLASGPVEPLADNDLRQLQEYMNQLSLPRILNAVDSDRQPARRTVFSLFFQNSSVSLTLAKANQTKQLHRHLADRAVRANRQNIGHYLMRLRCPSGSVSPHSGQNVRSDQSNFDDVLGGPIEEALSWTNLIILLTGCSFAYVGTRAFQIWRAQQKRRSERHSCNFPIQYKSGHQQHAGVMIDISGKGTKIRHDPDSQVGQGTGIALLIFDVWKTGIVAWSNPNYCGIVFDRVLDSKSVRDISAPAQQQLNGQNAKTAPEWTPHH